ncbi:MAG: hypothetical protein ACRD1T_09010 [Acidimicrobiia bacterium]
MAAEPGEIRMARLEGAYEQINQRLGAIDQRMSALEQRLGAEIPAVRLEILDHRRQATGQFYWLLTFVLGSIFVPILRDLIR